MLAIFLSKLLLMLVIMNQSYTLEQCLFIIIILNIQMVVVIYVIHFDNRMDVITFPLFEIFVVFIFYTYTTYYGYIIAYIFLSDIINTLILLIAVIKIVRKEWKLRNK